MTSISMELNVPDEVTNTVTFVGFYRMETSGHLASGQLIYLSQNELLM